MKVIVIHALRDSRYQIKLVSDHPIRQLQKIITQLLKIKNIILVLKIKNKRLPASDAEMSPLNYPTTRKFSPSIVFLKS